MLQAGGGGVFTQEYFASIVPDLFAGGKIDLRRLSRRGPASGEVEIANDNGTRWRFMENGPKRKSLYGAMSRLPHSAFGVIVLPRILVARH